MQQYIKVLIYYRLGGMRKPVWDAPLPPPQGLRLATQFHL